MKQIHSDLHQVVRPLAGALPTGRARRSSTDGAQLCSCPNPSRPSGPVLDNDEVWGQEPGQAIVSYGIETSVDICSD